MGAFLPLGRCQGDCDSDRDCADYLICFQRTRFTPVPGCSGGSNDGSLSDYCVRLSDTDTDDTAPNNQVEVRNEGTGGRLPAIRKVGNNIFKPNTYPLDLCEGDCDDNSDCRGNLVCQQRDRYHAVFGCRGGSADSSQQDYCIHPDAVLPPKERPAYPYVSLPFRLKLYWQEGYRWQEETSESK